MSKPVIGIKEGVIVLIAGLVLAFAGNAIYGDSGIDISRSTYFAKAERLPLRFGTWRFEVTIA